MDDFPFITLPAGFKDRWGYCDEFDICMAGILPTPW
jgi:hypothetical protein